MKNKILLLAAIAAMLVFVICGCSAEEEEIEEINPEEFSYDMLDISFLADEIYKCLDISELTMESVSPVTDETTLAEQYYLDLSKIVAFDIRSAEGKYGVADVAVIRVEEGAADEIMESLEMRKDDRINEFLNYNVYDSYEIALEAEIYEVGELVIMLMLPEEGKSEAKEIIDYYLP